MFNFFKKPTINKDTIMVQKELLSVGIQVDSVYELVNNKKPYPEAIPVLIKLLPKVSDDGIKEGIIRALSVKEARGMGSYLIAEYYNISEEKSLLRWAVGNAIDVVITDDDTEDVLEIVSDKNNGMSRQMFVLALGKVSDSSSKVRNMLHTLLKDDEVSKHAKSALKKIEKRYER